MLGHGDSIAVSSGLVADADPVVVLGEYTVMRTVSGKGAIVSLAMHGHPLATV